MMVKTPDSPGRGGRRDALLPPLPGLWARGLATTGCTWPDCRRTAFHPWLQPAAPPGQKRNKTALSKNRVNPNFLTAQPYAAHRPLSIVASEYAVTLPYFVADVNTAKEVSGVRCQVSEGKLLVASDALARRGNGVRRSQIGDGRWEIGTR